MTLERYRTKRDFGRTPEPSGDGGPGPSATPGRRFVVQRHRARRLHYDFRLEMDGVLASWAVPKGPSLDPGVRRAAFHVEDHPLDYYDFEGTIPRGEYGAGDVIVWDWGTYEPEATADPGKAVREGELKLTLHGEKLRGRFTLVKTKGSPDDGHQDDSWLLIKKRDDSAVTGWDVEAHPQSVKTGRTNDQVAAGMPATASRPGPAADSLEPDRIPGKPGPMPDFVEPMKATLVDRPFSDPRWLFELKWDGWRLQAHVRDGRLGLFSRRGLDALGQFPELRDLPSSLAAHEAILDGEVVALDPQGKPSFSLLQGRRRAGGHGTDGPAIVYQVFDLLYLDGRSLLDVPLVERKDLLRSILRESTSLRYAGHVESDGEEFFRAVSERDLEGMVAKLRASRYESGRRSTAWLKIKRRAEQELVVGGWTARDGDASEPDLAALLLGVYEDGTLRPVGKAGTGWDARMRRDIVAALEPLHRDTSPFRPVPREKGARWVDPTLVVRVEFAEWTADGNLRAASFKGMDPDVDPKTVTRERSATTGRLVSAAEATAARATAAPANVAPASVAPPNVAPASVAPANVAPATAAAGPRPSSAELAALDALPGKGGLWDVAGRTLKLTNLDKVLWPDDGITKRDLIRYYVSMAPYLLPYLEGRAITLRRYPDGVARTGFWQKQTPKHAPEWIDCWSWESRSTKEQTDYILVDSVAALGWIANEAAIDVHPSTFCIAAPETPTWALVDIDPGTKTTWEELLLFARLYGTALGHVGVRGFPKVTGQRGIQVWIPVEPAYTFDQTRDWVAALSRTIAAAAPGLVSWEWEKNQRQGLARLDYTQNAWNKTLVAPYSLRPGPGAPVSAPITWDELDDPDLRPNRWTIADMAERAAKRGDLFRPALELRQKLPSL